jgi:hypothetical protein
MNRMKRKEYHQRLLISASVEQDRWKDFQELCDKECKSYSMKINELIGEELQKNALGSEENPIGVIYLLNKQEQKGFQSDIRLFMRRNDIIKIAKDLTSQECDIIANNLLRVSRFKREGVIEV